MINAENFEDIQPARQVDSPTSLSAMRSLGYVQSDLVKQTREQILAKEKDKLARLTNDKQKEFLDMKANHTEQQRQHRLEQLRELRKKLTEDALKKEHLKSTQLQTASVQSTAFNKEEFLKKEHQKIEKLKERQQKQVETFVKHQAYADDLRKRDNEKLEKIKRLEEAKKLAMKVKHEESVEAKKLRDLKALEDARKRQEESNLHVKQYEEKQEKIEEKLQKKEQENEEKRAKNQEERELAEKKIALKMEEQAQKLQELYQTFQKKEEYNLKKKREYEEKQEEHFQKRRVASEQKKYQINEQQTYFQMIEEERHEKLQRNYNEKITKLADLNEHKDNERHSESIRRQAQIDKVRQQFKDSLINLDLQRQSVNQHLQEMLEKAASKRAIISQEQQLKQYENSMKLEETLENVKRQQKAKENNRQLVLAKILEENAKEEQIQREKMEVERVKAKIRADNIREQIQLKSQFAKIEQGKADNSFVGQESSVFRSKTENESKYNDNTVSSQQGQKSISSRLSAHQSSSNLGNNHYHQHRNNHHSQHQLGAKNNTNHHKSASSLLLTDLKMYENSSRNDIKAQDDQKDITAGSQCYSYKSQSSRNINGSMLKQRLMDVSTTKALVSKSIFQIELKSTEKPVKRKIEYNSNKFVKSVLSENYLDSVLTNQKIVIQDIHLLLCNKVLTTMATAESLKDEEKLEKIVNELKPIFSKQEAQAERIHSLYSLLQIPPSAN